MTAPYHTWQTPAELAAELRPDDDPATATKWVERQMAAGVIPSIKVGRRRYFTPACREQMEREQLGQQDTGWSQITRAKRTA